MERRIRDSRSTRLRFRPKTKLRPSGWSKDDSVSRPDGGRSWRGYGGRCKSRRHELGRTVRFGKLGSSFEDSAESRGPSGRAPGSAPSDTPHVPRRTDGDASQPHERRSKPDFGPSTAHVHRDATPYRLPGTPAPSAPPEDHDAAYFRKLQQSSTSANFYSTPTPNSGPQGLTSSTEAGDHEAPSRIKSGSPIVQGIK